MMTTETLLAVGALIQELREAGATAPITGPEFRSLCEIVADARREGARVVAIGPDGGPVQIAGSWPLHPMAAAPDYDEDEDEEMEDDDDDVDDDDDGDGDW